MQKIVWEFAHYLQKYLKALLAEKCYDIPPTRHCVAMVQGTVGHPLIRTLHVPPQFLKRFFCTEFENSCNNFITVTFSIPFCTQVFFHFTLSCTRLSFWSLKAWLKANLTYCLQHTQVWELSTKKPDSYVTVLKQSSPSDLIEKPLLSTVKAAQSSKQACCKQLTNTAGSSISYPPGELSCQRDGINIVKRVV